MAGSFADDAYMAAEGDSMEKAVAKVEDMIRWVGGASKWAETHYSLYEMKKFVGMGFTRRREKAEGTEGGPRPATRLGIEVNGTVIKM